MNKNKKYTEQQEKLAKFAKALGHPARIAILDFWLNVILVSLAALMMSFRLQRQLFLSILKS
jgi:hypothetical protein